MKAVYYVTEAQTGGSLHMHGQLFGMIDQRVLTRWIHEKAFRQEVCNFMDAIATAEIPDTVLSVSKQQPSSVPVGFQPYPSADDVQQDSGYCRLKLNRHRHCFTCWKGECLTCRLSYPRPFAKRTYITEIVPDPTNTKDLVPIRRFPSTLCTYVYTIVVVIAGYAMYLRL